MTAVSEPQTAAHHNIVGDLTTCEGSVSRTWTEGDEHLVEVDVRGTNQNGEVTIVGHAVAELPAKGAQHG